MGTDRFILQGDYGSQPWGKVKASLERFSRSVMPELKAFSL